MLKNKWFKKIIRAILIGGFSSFIFCPYCFSDPQEENARVLLYYILTFFVVYELAEMSAKYFNKKYNWITQLYKILWANAVFIVLVFIPLNYIAIEIIFGLYPEQYSEAQIYFLNLNNLFTIIIVLLYINSTYFFSSWEKSLIKNQEISKQRIKQELLALKNQINPHFLFNNLNTLSHLVSEKSQEAEAYIIQFSTIYRYLLEEKKADLVAIEKEFKMIHSFMYLLKIKHGDAVEFIYKTEDFKNFKIATFTLQLLIENAVKHNIISPENKLFISIFVEHPYLIVKNNVLQKANYIYSSGIGLDNIINRYKILSQKEVIIEETDKEFVVKIPIIDYEHTYR
ncbi:MAG: histidine kinase [Flavobacteriaceae bacterium]